MNNQTEPEKVEGIEEQPEEEIKLSQIVENEFRIEILERLIEHLFNDNPNLKRPDPEEMEKIRREVAEKLDKKYPSTKVSL